MPLMFLIVVGITVFQSQHPVRLSEIAGASEAWFQVWSPIGLTYSRSPRCCGSSSGWACGTIGGKIHFPMSRCRTSQELAHGLLDRLTNRRELDGGSPFETAGESRCDMPSVRNPSRPTRAACATSAAVPIATAPTGVHHSELVNPGDSLELASLDSFQQIGTVTV
jgi:hypothetical protein